MSDTKKPYLSKTVWVNVIIAVAAFIPAVQAWVLANPQAVMQSIALIGIGLRMATKDAISLQD